MDNTPDILFIDDNTPDYKHKHLKRSLSSIDEKMKNKGNNSNINNTPNKGYENIELTLEDMLQKNANEFVCDQQKRGEELDKMVENLRILTKDNNGLKAELESERTRARDLELVLSKVQKELDEFKKINTIQENCIENSESEILRLSGCLRVTEERFQETVEISEVSLICISIESRLFKRVLQIKK